MMGHSFHPDRRPAPEPDVGPSASPESPLGELRRLLFQTEQRLRAAEAQNAARVEFLARISHELRTPLNAITGYVELLLDGVQGPLAPDQLRTLERVRSVHRLLLTLIDDLLSYTRLEGGRIECRIEEIALAPTLCEARDVILPQAAAKEVRYAASCPEEIRVRADRERLRQILLNLMGNALKFTPPSGRIEVRARTADDDPPRVLVEVKDTGCGIPPGDIERIFEAFVQVDEGIPGQATERGLGLGLAISRDLARRMEGDILAESVPGQGSTFTLVLPRAAPSPEPIPIDAAAGPRGALSPGPGRTSRAGGSRRRAPKPRAPRR